MLLPMFLTILGVGGGMVTETGTGVKERLHGGPIAPFDQWIGPRQTLAFELWGKRPPALFGLR